MNRFVSVCIINSVLTVAVFNSGCVSAGNTDHIPAVVGFDISRYLGVWYEIVRNDHRFERGLSRVTATYTDTGDGTFGVVNRGYNAADGEWKAAAAKGKYTSGSDRGELRVTFFWPFSARYRIIELGADYEYAVVTSRSSKYFWILSRSPVMDSTLLGEILERAVQWGFDISGIIRVDQSPLEAAMETAADPGGQP